MKTFRILATKLIGLSCLLSSFSCNTTDDQQTKVLSEPRPVSSHPVSPSVPETVSSPPKVLTSSQPAQQQGATLSGKAEVKDAYGDVQQRTDGVAAWKPVNVGDLLSPATSVRTGKDAAVLLLLADRHVVRVGAETTLRLSELGRNRSFSFELVQGRFWSFVNNALKPTKYEVETPSAVVGVSGTVFSVFYQPRSQVTLVSTAKGIVTVRQGQRAVKVMPGFGTRVPRNLRGPLRATPQDQPTQRMWHLLRSQELWLQGARSQKLEASPDGRLRLNRQVQSNSELRRLQTRLEQLELKARPNSRLPKPLQRVLPARVKRALQPVRSQPNLGKSAKRQGAQPLKKSLKIRPNRKSFKAKTPRIKYEKAKYQKVKRQKVRRAMRRSLSHAGRSDIGNALRTIVTGSKGSGRLKDFEAVSKIKRRDKEPERKARGGNKRSGAGESRDKHFDVGEFLNDGRKNKRY